MANRNQGEEGVHEQSETETGVHDSPNPDATPGQSSASDWDMNRTKPNGDSDRKPDSQAAPKKKPQAQQAPQDGHR
jgi:hypothetical protein